MCTYTTVQLEHNFSYPRSLQEWQKLNEIYIKIASKLNLK